MAEHKDVDDVTGIETTGHSWDGIKELNTPLPRWWLIIFYATIAWAIVYWVLMPAWPGLPGGTWTKGLRGESDRINIVTEMASLDAARSQNAQSLLGKPLEAIEADPDLFQFALASGESAFGDNCATCHGAGGRGNVGFPRLADDIWIWGGTLEDIQYTIRHGIRNDQDTDARYSQMPAFGRDGLLTDAELNDVTAHVLQLSGAEHDAASATRGATLFEINCASCHGLDGKGDRTQGAPNLTDADWLYGSTPEVIKASIYRGPYGVMPPWSERLDEATITALSVYVHSLGGGERSAG